MTDAENLNEYKCNIFFYLQISTSCKNKHKLLCVSLLIYSIHVGCFLFSFCYYTFYCFSLTELFISVNQLLVRKQDKTVIY